MKFVVLIIVVLAIVWFIRGGARRDTHAGNERRSRDSSAPPGAPQDMVQCPVCLVHLPRGDALPGPKGQLYCCAEHRVRDGG